MGNPGSESGRRQERRATHTEAAAQRRAIAAATERVYAPDEAEILQRAATIEDEMRQRLLYTVKTEVYEEAITRELSKRGIQRQEWDSVVRLTTLSDDSLTQTDRTIRSFTLLHIVQPIEESVTASLAMAERLSDRIRPYAYELARLEFDRKQLLRAELTQRAAADPLTGFIADKQYAAKLYEIEKIRLEHGPTKRCMLVIQIDLDDFKLLNDSHPQGHEGVDRDILIPLAKALEQNFRSFDMKGVTEATDVRTHKGRHGGDEMYLVINDINLEVQPQAGADLANIMNDPDNSTHPVIRRILSKVERAIQSIPRPDGNPLTGSIGFLVVQAQQAAQALTFEEALSLADRAVQYSKRAGNGNITEHRPHLPEQKKDLEYFRRLALKALRRVFPGVDIENVAAAEVDDLAKRLLTVHEETT